MRTQWLDHCIRLAGKKADLYSGCRKILRNRSLYFDNPDNSLQLSDAGYTQSKMTMLTKNYLHIESQQVALELWERRKAQAKYGSVSFTTFNHFVKGKGTVQEIADKGSKRASVFGPCIQSVCLTWVDKDTTAVDIFYRTSELFKKFPADLVFIRDVLLGPFNLGNYRLGCHFANITAHPQYIITLFPSMENPIQFLEYIKQRDEYFWKWSLKWAGRMICPEHHRGIAKFAQAMRVHKDANERIDPQTLIVLQKYIRENHPGYRNSYEPPEEDED